MLFIKIVLAVIAAIVVLSIGQLLLAIFSIWWFGKTTPDEEPQTNAAKQQEASE